MLSPAKVTVLASVSPAKNNMIFFNIIFTPFYMDSESIVLLNTIAKKFILQIGI